MTDGFQRARSPEAKLQREDAILEAASRLAARRGVRAITLTDIADEVGMHKSALLRYFETRELIFLRLTIAGWQEWSADVRPRLAEAHGPSEVARLLAQSLADRPLFCDLLAQAPLNLERNVSVESARAFKLAVLAEVAAITTAIARATGLGEEDAGDVLTAATSLSGALWQMATPPAEIARLYREDPRLAHAVVDVPVRVAHIVEGMTRGFLAD